MKEWMCLTSIWAILATNSVYSSDWQSHWFNGATALKNNEFNKAVEEYTLAINSNSSNHVSKHLYLYNERANAYFKNGYSKPEDYKKAIQDLSIVIDSKDTNLNDRINALWLRGQAYLASGMKEGFMKDSGQIEKMAPYFTQLEENENYASFKLGDSMSFNENVKNAFVKTLHMNQIINSENDVIFTSSNMGIIKKTNGNKSIVEMFRN